MRIPNQVKGQVRSKSRSKWVRMADLYPSAQIHFYSALSPVTNEIEYEPFDDDYEEIPLSIASRLEIPESPVDYGNCVASCVEAGGSLSECRNGCLEWIDA